MSDQNKPRDAFVEGNEFCNREEWDRAVDCYREALQATPRHEWALNNAGFCLAKAGKHDEAVVMLKRAIAVNPENPMAHANMIMAIEGTGDNVAALPYRRRLALLKPDVADYSFALANALLSIGRADEAILYYRRALQVAPDHMAAVSNHLLALNYSDTVTAEEVALEHFRAGMRWPRRHKPEGFVRSRTPNRPLRIGYLSGDFGHHPVGKLMATILAAHHSERFEVYAYSDRDAEDAWTARIRNEVAFFRPIAKLSHDELEQVMLGDRLDVVIELTGHTDGRNRLEVLSRGVAPVQASFLGYPNTTGCPGIDYRLTDRHSDPPGRVERFYTEKLVYLERGFLCYSPPEDLPPVIDTPCLSQGWVTFGTFNNPSKIPESTLVVWSEILKAVPGSRLHVKYGGKFSSETLRDRWRERFGGSGIDPGRLLFFAAAPTLPDHFRAIGKVDLALDSFPYQGTMTTLETLSMGVPLVTLSGDTSSRRASSALLHRSGLGELVTESVQEYVSKAVELASSPERLRQLRASIRGQFLQSQICDVEGFVTELEGTYRRLWGEWDRLNPLVGQDRAGSEKNPPNDLVVLCTGMPRSGSTWSYNVCRLLLEGTLGADKVRASYQESGNADAYLKSRDQFDGSHVVKLHYPGPGVMGAVHNGLVKNICTSRHPMEAVASFREKFGMSLEVAARLIQKSMVAAQKWRHESDTLFVDFAEITSQPRDQIKRIAQYLELEVTEELVSRVEMETSLENVRRIVKEMESVPEETLSISDGSRYDPITLYHIGHAPKATARNWREELTQPEQDLVREILGSLFSG